METVNNVVTGASKLIWGEGSTTQAGEEPVNGQKGAGTASEPFDKGNDETTTTKTTNPAESGSVPHQKQQGADRPTEEPSHAQTAAISDKKEAAESTQDKASTSHTKITSDEERNKLAEKGELPHDPNDHSGEPMKMHAGGDPEAKVEGETLKEKTERSASVGQEGGGEHGKVKGTGEEWVKTSGIAAEGGDFDATKPGAGKEATRLMEQKGIKTEGATLDPTAAKPDTASATSEEKAKVSKMAKLKDKLHIGSGKNLS